MTARRAGRYAGRPMESGQTQAALLVLTTCDSSAQAEALAEHLVERRLAACVNVLGAVRSTYRWGDAIEHASEALLVIKTTAARYAEIEATIRDRSGYELPEVVAVPIAQGLAGYLDWVRAATRGAGAFAAVPPDDGV